MSNPLSQFDDVVSAPVVAPITITGVDGMYSRLFPNDIYRYLAKVESEFPDKWISTSFWWIIAVGVTNEFGSPLFYNKLPAMEGPFPTTDEANKLEEQYGHPAARKLCDKMWEAVMSHNGYIMAKEGDDGKK